MFFPQGGWHTSVSQQDWANPVWSGTGEAEWVQPGGIRRTKPGFQPLLTIKDNEGIADDQRSGGKHFWMVKK